MRLDVLPLAMLGLIGWACAPGSEPAGDWVAGAAGVRPAVHSVWGSRPVLDGLTAFTPVGTAFTVAVDSGGALLLSNAHVAADVDGLPWRRLSVLVSTDTTQVLYVASLVAVDTARDLALLRIPDTAAVAVEWAAERVAMGTPVATIGYGLPEGGIVDTTGSQVKTRFTAPRRFSAGYSSSYRTLEAGDPSTNILEVDLFLYPGMSGGPTFGRDGRVIGVNQGVRELGAGTTSYAHVIPVLVVRQFLATAGYEDQVFRTAGEPSRGR
jgi:S1-C subfamily serine protease